MSRRKTEPGDIRNPEHYFNRFIANEILRDQQEEQDYYAFFESLDELTERGYFSKLQIDRNFSAPKADVSDGFFSWIDQIENECLFEAVQKVSETDKIILTLRFQHLLTQRETADYLGVSQMTVSNHERSLKKFFRNFLKNAFQKWRF